MDKITDYEFTLIRDYIKSKFAINLTEQKKQHICITLDPVLENLGFSNYTQYYEYLISDTTGKATMLFIDRMTTNHTYFMREADHFEYFAKTVLPQLENTVKDKDIRIWCAGCSSGEEAYTLQMHLTDYFGWKMGWNTQLLATDISVSALNKASLGIYPKENVSKLNREWLRKYFEEYDKDKVVVSKEIKEKIVFRLFNLKEETFPLKNKVHAIFCRNVMIYFDKKEREELIQKFYDCSEEGGYLFIGHSEVIEIKDASYKHVKPAIYIK